MVLLNQQQITAAFTRLGQLAEAEGVTSQLVVVGGAAMVLGYQARESTHDIDAIFLPPPEARVVRMWAAVIAREFNWPEDWLNDAAKGYVVGLSQGPILMEAPGILVRQPASEQLLADLSHVGSRDAVWQRVVPYLFPGSELKARYAFDDLWESRHGDA